MTNSTALVILDDIFGKEKKYQDKQLYKELRQAIRSAIIKQIPQEPTCSEINQNYSPFDNSPERIYKCPTCESKIFGNKIFRSINYCSNCGQKIDWS